MQESVKRKLSVILSVDVESYRRHMGDDEEASVLSLTPYRELYHSHILTLQSCGHGPLPACDAHSKPDKTIDSSQESP